MKNRLIFVSIVICTATGCNRQDGDRLARVGGKVTEKVQLLVPERTPFGRPTNLAMNPNVEERVKERFRSDRFLGPLFIEVSAEGHVIRLKGKVNDGLLKQRAVEIAESTVDVDKVLDEIVVEK